MTVLAIVPITIVIGTLIAVISYVVYRRHLNRVLSGEERGAHSKAADPGAVFKAVLICIFSVWMLVTTIDLSIAKDNLNSQLNQINANTQNLRSQIYQLEEKLEAQSNLTEDLCYTFGKINVEDRTVDIDFSVTLKKYSEDSVVSICFGNEKTVLTHEDGTFSGVLTANLFKLYETWPILTVKTGEVTETQILDGSFDGYMADYCLPRMQYMFNGYHMTFERKGNMKLTGKTTIYHFSQSTCPLKITSARIIVTVENEVVKAIPLTFVDDSAEDVSLDCSFAVNENASVALFVEYQTEEGWTIREQMEYYSWELASEVAIAPMITVTDSDGVALFREFE